MNIEITVRDLKQIGDIHQIIRDLNPSQINITDKNGLLDNLMVIDALRQIIPNAHYVPHYCFKNHTNKDYQVIVENFSEMLITAATQDVNEILLVSGSPRPKLDTIKGLELARSIMSENRIDTLHFSVAYNPFLEGEALEEENLRLKAKLENPRVTKVYLQMGTLVHPLQQGVAYVKSLNTNLEIYSSIIIPTENFLTKFRFRPWKGVLLDEKYLANHKNAVQKTKELLKLSADIGIKQLIELVGIQFVKAEELRETYGDLLDL